MRLDAGEGIADRRRGRAISANQPMAPEQPDVAKCAYRLNWGVRRFFRIG
jgi:hypothetical protein